MTGESLRHEHKVVVEFAFARAQKQEGEILGGYSLLSQGLDYTWLPTVPLKITRNEGAMASGTDTTVLTESQDAVR